MTHAAEPSATEPELAQALDPADQLTESAAAALLPEAFARLYGEPLTEIPKDLYIPPDALGNPRELRGTTRSPTLFNSQTELQYS